MSSSDHDHMVHGDAEVPGSPPFSPPRWQAHPSKRGSPVLTSTMNKLQSVDWVPQASHDQRITAPQTLFFHDCDGNAQEMHESAQALLDVGADDNVKNDAAGPRLTPPLPAPALPRPALPRLPSRSSPPSIYVRAIIVTLRCAGAGPCGCHRPGP